MSKIKWNDNFDMERHVNGEKIIVGQQDFENGTILVKDSKEDIKNWPMGIDDKGDIFFIYKGIKMYVSEYV